MSKNCQGKTTWCVALSWVLVSVVLTAGVEAHGPLFGRCSYDRYVCAGATQTVCVPQCGNPCGNACCGQPGVWLHGETVSLFNGKDLTGWTNVTGTGAPDVWSVRDGNIVKVNPSATDKVKKSTGDLFYKEKFEDFILEFDVKISKKGNSGVKYKSWNTKGFGLGCEFQVFDDVNVPDNPPVYRTGALYAVYAPNPGTAPMKMDGYNHGRIVVMGNHVEHWLNGQQTVSAEIGSCDWLQRVANSKFADTPEFGTTRLGRIMLQDHGSEVWFKNISITPLYRMACPGFAW